MSTRGYNVVGMKAEDAPDISDGLATELPGRGLAHEMRRNGLLIDAARLHQDRRQGRT
jgi:hypothetical protein